MKAEINKDGLVNIMGLTKKQALWLANLTGNIQNYKETSGIFSALAVLFPKYIDSWNRNGGFYSGNIKIDGKTIEVHKAIVDGLLEPKPVIKPNVLAFPIVPAKSQRRDANGRFAKKVWVARFSYPDSNQPWINRNRVVVTKYEGKRSPILNIGQFIEGHDKSRNNELRKFTLRKIVGNMNWNKEYAN